MNENEKINYVEFPSKDIDATKAFFASAFSWSFVDYGPEYAAFSDEGIDGGFYKSDLTASSENGGALIVFYSADLKKHNQKLKVPVAQFLSPYSHFLVGVVSISVIPMVTNMQSGQI